MKTELSSNPLQLPAPDRHEASRQAFEVAHPYLSHAWNETKNRYRDSTTLGLYEVWCAALDWVEQEDEKRHQRIKAGLAEAIAAHPELDHAAQEQPQNKGQISDGYHTFDELYEHRCSLFLALMASNPAISWASTLHDDGSSFDGWFIAGMNLPTGTVTYHLPAGMWSLACETKATILERAPKWDGHTAADVVKRLQAWVTSKAQEQPAPEPTQGSAWEWANERIFPHGCDRSWPVVGLLSEENALELADRADAAERKLAKLHVMYQEAIKDHADMEDQLAAALAEARKLREALQGLLDFVEQETCLHEETHRGGAIWEICDRCGAKWADDEGGKPDDASDWPEPVTNARAALTPNTNEK